MDAIAFRVIPAPDEDGFRAIIPAFPRIFTCSNTVEDALAMASDVISLELSLMLERGEEFPDPDGDAETRVERVVVTPPSVLTPPRVQLVAIAGEWLPFEPIGPLAQSAPLILTRGHALCRPL